MEIGRLIDALSRADAYPHMFERIEVYQTRISAAILAGPFASKVKKPVEFGFVDFSTLERRRNCCEEGIRLNRRLAPDVDLRGGRSPGRGNRSGWRAGVRWSNGP
jgi:aminoglycoside phosphotransferase family enzyme